MTNFLFTPLEQFNINILIFCTPSIFTFSTISLFLILISFLLINFYFFGFIYNPLFI